MEITTQNKRYKAIVVDDEPLARQLLVTSLQAFPEIEVVAECANGREAVDAVNSSSPDLMFLDIQMPGWGGFEVIRRIGPETMPEVIFVTAFDNFAIDAFDANAVDYLLKPFGEERLERAVRRVITQLSQDSSNLNEKRSLYSAVNKIADRVKRKSEHQDGPVQHDVEGRKISIKDGDSVFLVDEDSIDWIDAAGDYMCINASGETHVIRSTMHELLDRLKGGNFARVHRSTIVNMDRIIKIQRHTKGEYFLHLDCDKTVKVSRYYKSVIRDFIDNQP